MYEYFKYEHLCFLNILQVKKLFAKWKPLIEPSFGLAEMSRIRRGFDSVNESTDQSAESLSQTRQRDEALFTQLLFSAWLPIIE